MFAEYVFDRSGAEYADNVLLIDDENLSKRIDYLSAFSAHGFEIIRYTDDLSFRINHEKKLNEPNKRVAVIASSYQYIPYDIRCKMRTYNVSFENMFDKLNIEPLSKMRSTDIELLCEAYKNNFDYFPSRKDTERYLRDNVYTYDNAKEYLSNAIPKITERAEQAADYRDWFKIAEQKAQAEVIAAQYGIETDMRQINTRFQAYILADFGKLSRELDKQSPVLVSKAMDYIHSRSDKFVIIVMDGMSEFDWYIISSSFDGLQYEKSSVFAMAPSTTSISRQCLLSGKYPVQLEEPWKQSKEKKEFVNCAKNLGYSDNQIGYERGYDVQFNSAVRCGAVIINDVDDMVHSQIQGRQGMFNDITLLAKQKRLFEMSKRFLSCGFDVYITADHGNTPCRGVGKLFGTGVETETKSRRMLVLKDFADKRGLIDKYGLVEYPKYYLPKEYNYLICNIGDSFDAKGEEVMTHGGITLEEMAVPFIKIKAV